MRKRSVVDLDTLARTLREQRQVVRRSQVIACGVPHSTIDRKIAPGGPWQVLLPGVYLAVTGTVSQLHRQLAALLHAGQQGVITGPDAIRLHGLRSAGPDTVHVLVPMSVRRQSIGFVQLHRTERMPATWHVAGPLRFAEVPRAVSDTARILTCFDDVRAVVCEAVQRRACSVHDLFTELDEGPSVRSAPLRNALAEVGDGVRSVAEADFRLLVIRGRLPRPMFNARLFTPDGTFIAMVDAWWKDAGVAAEVDSRAYHLSAAAQDRDRKRHARLVKHGVLPLHFAPSRVRDEGPEILDEIRSAIGKGLQRPPLPIVAFPPEPIVPIR
jgi:hypothetical protein